MKTSAFLNMELQTGTEKLAEALVLRGFPVIVEKDFITLRNGSERDYMELRFFLDKLNIPVFWNGNRFQLLTNHFPMQKMKQIIQHPGREHSIHMEGYHFKWRSFTGRRYGIRTNTLELCPYTAVLVKALNEAGIVTLAGCHGHGKHSPNFKLAGVYAGIWFNIIQEKHLKKHSLHYQWKVHFQPGCSNASIIAYKRTNEAWDMKKVLADCYKMAMTLTEKASEIREWKAGAFRRSMKGRAEEMRAEGDIKELQRWMEEVLGQVYFSR